jgi:hypothetical protein
MFKMRLFKEIEIGTNFTSPDLATGTLIKLSAKKYAIAGSGDDKGTICSINTQVNVIPDPIDDATAARACGVKGTKSEQTTTMVAPIVGLKVHELIAQRVNEQYLMAKPSPSKEVESKEDIPPAKFDPAAIIAEIRRKSWRNYTVTEYRGENEDPIVSLLGNIATNEDFLETICWDGNGNPLFSEDGITITLPEGVTEADYTGFMETAIPDVYTRRVILFRAQGLTGMKLYEALVFANTGTMTGHGSGVSRRAHLSIVKTKTRVQNRSKRKDRVRNLRRAA